MNNIIKDLIYAVAKLVYVKTGIFLRNQNRNIKVRKEMKLER